MSDDSDDIAVLLFCHGARDPAWRVPFDAIQASLVARLPQRAVGLAFLEFMQPAFEAEFARLVEQGARAVRVVPLFLAAGGHTRRDLAALVETARLRFPEVRVSTAETLTDSPEIRAAITEWVATQVTVVTAARSA